MLPRKSVASVESSDNSLPLGSRSTASSSSKCSCEFKCSCKIISRPIQTNSSNLQALSGLKKPNRSASLEQGQIARDFERPLRNMRQSRANQNTTSDLTQYHPLLSQPISMAAFDFSPASSESGSGIHVPCVSRSRSADVSLENTSSRIANSLIDKKQSNKNMRIQSVGTNQRSKDIAYLPKLGSPKVKLGSISDLPYTTTHPSFSSTQSPSRLVHVLKNALSLSLEYDRQEHSIDREKLDQVLSLRGSHNVIGHISGDSSRRVLRLFPDNDTSEEVCTFSMDSPILSQISSSVSPRKSPFERITSGSIHPISFPLHSSSSLSTNLSPPKPSSIPLNSRSSLTNPCVFLHTATQPSVNFAGGEIGDTFPTQEINSTFDGDNRASHISFTSSSHPIPSASPLHIAMNAPKTGTSASVSYDILKHRDVSTASTKSPNTPPLEKQESIVSSYPFQHVRHLQTSLLDQHSVSSILRPTATANDSVAVSYSHLNTHSKPYSRSLPKPQPKPRPEPVSTSASTSPSMCASSNSAILRDATLVVPDYLKQYSQEVLSSSLCTYPLQRLIPLTQLEELKRECRNSTFSSSLSFTQTPSLSLERLDGSEFCQSFGNNDVERTCEQSQKQVSSSRSAEEENRKNLSFHIVSRAQTHDLIRKDVEELRYALDGLSKHLTSSQEDIAVRNSSLRAIHSLTARQSTNAFGKLKSDKEHESASIEFSLHDEKASLLSSTDSFTSPLFNGEVAIRGGVFTSICYDITTALDAVSMRISNRRHSTFDKTIEEWVSFETELWAVVNTLVGLLIALIFQVSLTHATLGKNKRLGALWRMPTFEPQSKHTQSNNITSPQGLGCEKVEKVEKVKCTREGERDEKKVDWNLPPQLLFILLRLLLLAEEDTPKARQELRENLQVPYSAVKVKDDVEGLVSPISLFPHFFPPDRALHAPQTSRTSQTSLASSIEQNEHFTAIMASSPAIAANSSQSRVFSTPMSTLTSSSSPSSSSLCSSSSFLLGRRSRRSQTHTAEATPNASIASSVPGSTTTPLGQPGILHTLGISTTSASRLASTSGESQILSSSSSFSSSSFSSTPNSGSSFYGENINNCTPTLPTDLVVGVSEEVESKSSNRTHAKLAECIHTALSSLSHSLDPFFSLIWEDSTRTPSSTLQSSFPWLEPLLGSKEATKSLGDILPSLTRAFDEVIRELDSTPSLQLKNKVLQQNFNPFPDICEVSESFPSQLTTTISRKSGLSKVCSSSASLALFALFLLVNTFHFAPEALLAVDTVGSTSSTTTGTITTTLNSSDASFVAAVTPSLSQRFSGDSYVTWMLSRALERWLKDANHPPTTLLSFSSLSSNSSTSCTLSVYMLLSLADALVRAKPVLVESFPTILPGLVRQPWKPTLCLSLGYALFVPQLSKNIKIVEDNTTLHQSCRTSTFPLQRDSFSPISLALYILDIFSILNSHEMISSEETSWLLRFISGLLINTMGSSAALSRRILKDGVQSVEDTHRNTPNNAQLCLVLDSSPVPSLSSSLLWVLLRPTVELCHRMEVFMSSPGHTLEKTAPGSIYEYIAKWGTVSLACSISLVNICEKHAEFVLRLASLQVSDFFHQKHEPRNDDFGKGKDGERDLKVERDKTYHKTHEVYALEEKSELSPFSSISTSEVSHDLFDVFLQAVDDEETTRSNSSSQVPKPWKDIKEQKITSKGSEKEQEQDAFLQSPVSSDSSLFSRYTRFMTHCLSFTRLCAHSSSTSPTSSSSDDDYKDKSPALAHDTSKTLGDVTTSLSSSHDLSMCPSNIRGSVLNAIIGSAHYISIFIALALRQAFPSSRSVISACEVIRRGTNAIHNTPFDGSSLLFRALTELPQHSLDILIATLSEFIMGQTRREEDDLGVRFNSNTQKSSVTEQKSSSETSSTWMDFSFQLLEHMTAIQSVLTNENIASIFISNNRVDNDRIPQHDHCQSQVYQKQSNMVDEDETHYNHAEKINVDVDSQVSSAPLSSAKISPSVKRYEVGPSVEVETTPLAFTKASCSRLLDRKESSRSFPAASSLTVSRFPSATSELIGGKVRHSNDGQKGYGEQKKIAQKDTNSGNDNDDDDDNIDPFDMLRRIKDDAFKAAQRSTKFLSQAWDESNEVRSNLNDSVDSLDANFESSVAAESVAEFDEILGLNQTSRASSRRKANESLFCIPKRQRRFRRGYEDDKEKE